MKTFEDVRARTDGPGADYYISANKLLSSPVVDVLLTVSRSGCGESTFMASSLLLADGSTLGLQGEHDEVYLEDYTGRPELSFEQARAIYGEDDE